MSARATGCPPGSGRIGRLLPAAILGLLSILQAQPAADPQDARIAALERQVAVLTEAVEQLQTALAAERAARVAGPVTPPAGAGETVAVAPPPIGRAVEEATAPGPAGVPTAVLATRPWTERIRIGGYGEAHATIGEGRDPDVLDLHRIVLGVDVDLADWIHFTTETEIEHAFVSSGSGGELVLEQAFMDVDLVEWFNVRAGRVLTPLGMINLHHEPPSFNGVERPSFARYIIPTTWSSDGIGAHGRLGESLNYEVYLVGGLDGSGFSPTGGIRGGRIKERPSLHDLAVTGRLDWFPLATEPAPFGQWLRLGLGGYYGGLDNGNNGRNPGVGEDIGILAADLDYAIGPLDVRGEIAWEKIDGAEHLDGVAAEILGWYVEAGVHVWPDGWRRGALSRADAILFGRYDDFDTQFDMPHGVQRDPAGDRDEWTFGVTFLPVPTVAFKADYQIRDDATRNDLGDRINLGIGFEF